MSRICLNMIVKNEAHVIARCLASVRPFIDRWVIVDTGSTDGTQDLIRRLLADVPGELHERPWRDFGHNRSEAIELARGQGDYLFTIDADEVLRLPEGFERPTLDADAYALRVDYDNVRYDRVCLIDSRLPWRWVGVLHEYLECGRPIERPTLHGPIVQVHSDGARSQQDVHVKYAQDARVLEAALRDEPDNTRYTFYLAQSYRDSGQNEAALACYERRAAMGGWEEEIWFSLYSSALLAEKLQHPSGEVVERYLRAFEQRPRRGGEALGQLARYCREARRFASARLFATQAMTVPLPEGDGLFVDRSWYLWRCRDEFAVASYWSGDPEGCRRECLGLLADPALPADQSERVRANLDFAERQLTATPGAR
ncbi:glycosyltransferase [Dokdonella sp.]|uniref:glycosyltransferase n=1 Tax=Dokdonella sp. TaxID=2291710 RepID=UPI002625EF03|nr:glycosyltransferase [Dokdonella sp.]